MEDIFPGSMLGLDEYGQDHHDPSLTLATKDHCSTTDGMGDSYITTFTSHLGSYARTGDNNHQNNIGASNRLEYPGTISIPDGAPLPICASVKHPLSHCPHALVSATVRNGTERAS